MSHEPCASRFRFAVSLRGFLLELMSGSSSPGHPKLPRRPATFQLPVPFSVTQAPIPIDDTECAATYKPAPHCGHTVPPAVGTRSCRTPHLSFFLEGGSRNGRRCNATITAAR